MSTNTQCRAGRREWLGLGVLALPLLVLALDVSVLYLAAPRLTADLDLSAVQQLWTLDIYGFFIAGFLIVMGSLGDRIGRRRLLLVGAVAFAAASLLAAFATSGVMLIGARAVLGVAGATLMPSTLALIRSMFVDPTQRRMAISVWMTAFSAGVAFGPLVGALLLAHFWWGSVFLLGVPVMGLLLLVGPWLLPEYREATPGRVDLLSVVLSLATMLPLVYGLKELAAYGVNALPLASLGVGTVIGVVFVRRQLRLPDPLLDVRLFARRTFVAAIALLLLGLIALNGLFYLIPQFLQLVRGASALQAGLWMLPIAATSVVASLLTPIVVQRVGRTRVIVGGAVLSLFGLLVLTGLDPSSGPVVFLGAAALAVFGFSPVGVLSTDLVVGSAPPERAGSAAALSETAGELGTALGVAAMGSVVVAVYRSHMADSLPAGVAPEAGDSLNSALAVTERLPAGLAMRVLDTGRAAFTQGLNTVAMVGIGLLAVLVAVTLVAFRDSNASAETPEA